MAAKKPARPVMIVVAGPPGSGKSTFFPIGALGVDALDRGEGADLEDVRADLNAIVRR